LGEEGPDFIDGNLGADRILGGDGDDALFDGENRRGARDVLLGGDGNDFLFPGNKPARQDIVVCGGGRDTAYADRTDVLIDCERVLFRAPTGRSLRTYSRGSSAPLNNCHNRGGPGSSSLVPSACPYPPKCLEEEFCELRL
jgi:hemolysin type calcium-binding protein